jgi:hypothetical protein
LYLSDEALEKQIARDLMFRRFIDLSLCESVPDHSSIWRFSQLPNTENLLEPLLEKINTHLEQNSIIVALGSINIIDATAIEANLYMNPTENLIELKHYMNPTKNLIEPKLYIIPTKNLIELKLYMNLTKNLIELKHYMNPTKILIELKHYMNPTKNR